jgi:hypothetical protein
LVNSTNRETAMDKQEDTATPAETPSPAKKAGTRTTRAKAATELPMIELPQLALSAIDLPKLDAPQSGPANPEFIAQPETAGDFRQQRPALLAACVALSAVLGAIAGAAATAALKEPPPAPPTAVAATDQALALKETVVRLASELTTLKASVDAANRSTAAQLTRFGERFDRAEKAQAEPATKLAKIAESLDRLERKTVAAAPAPEHTGSVTTVEKQQGKPPVVEGWKLLDFYAGRAVLESRSGGVYEVGAGSNLPGLGKVESVKREDGRVIVVTPKGIIASALEPPRRPGYYRY